MSITTKEYDLFIWRNNNISFFGVSQENQAKQITCNLYTSDINDKLLNAQSANYAAYLYVQLSPNFSARVEGVVDKINSKVSFDILNYLVPKQGCYSCFIALQHDTTVIKYGGMKFVVIDGVASSNTDNDDIIINNGINLNYILQYIYATMPLSETKEFKIKNREIAPSSPVKVTVKAKAIGSEATVIRTDGENLVDISTGNIVDGTMTEFVITANDVISGIKATEAMSVEVRYYSYSCEDLLQMINGSGTGFTVLNTVYDIDTSTQASTIFNVTEDN